MFTVRVKIHGLASNLIFCRTQHTERNAPCVASAVPRNARAAGRHDACPGGRRCARPTGLGAKHHLQVSWRPSHDSTSPDSARWSRPGNEDRRRGGGSSRGYGASCCSGRVVWSPTTPPWYSGSPTPAAWVRGTCIAEVVAPIPAPARQVVCGSLWSFSAGCFCAALVLWMVLMDLTWWSLEG